MNTEPEDGEMDAVRDAAPGGAERLRDGPYSNEQAALRETWLNRFVIGSMEASPG